MATYLNEDGSTGDDFHDACMALEPIDVMRILQNALQKMARRGCLCGYTNSHQVKCAIGAALDQADEVLRRS